jgi:lipoprotein-releasing system ATP-binding protein
MVLECINLVKEYCDGNNKNKVIDKINFKLDEGRSIAIVGPSGSGKSTFLHLLGGLDVPTKGFVKILKKDFSTLKENEKCKIRNEVFGFVYQQHHLLKDFTVLENIIMPLLIAGISFKESKKRAIKLMKLVDLDEKLKFKIGQLSGGEKQRVAILRAIINNPKCVLADEPTGNLDQYTAAKVYKTLIDVKKEIGTSLLTVTHDLTLANMMDETYVLNNGSLELKTF